MCDTIVPASQSYGEEQETVLNVETASTKAWLSIHDVVDYFQLIRFLLRPPPFPSFFLPSFRPLFSAFSFHLHSLAPLLPVWRS